VSLESAGEFSHDIRLRLLARAHAWLTPWRVRAIRHGLVLGGVILVLYEIVWVVLGGATDIYAYWSTGTDNAYVGYTIQDLYGHAYTPVFTLAFQPLRAIPFTVVYLGWFALNLSIALWLLAPLPRQWRLPCILLVSPELAFGNVHLIIGAAIVLAVSGRAWTLAFPILTKVTPGLAILWHLLRGDWRGVAWALGVSAILVAISWLIAPNLWPRWWTTVIANLGVRGPELAWVPLQIRLPVAVMLAVYAARTSRAWLLPVAVLVGLPHIFLQSLALLAACPRMAGAARPNVGAQSIDESAMASGVVTI
jgi:hypothetical protein